MATCKYCGKSSIFHRVTNNGMCPNCEAFVANDIKNRSRIYNESKEILQKSENPEVIISRISTAKETIIHFMTYEKKGIGIFEALPSVMLKDIEEKRDNIILEGFDRARKSLNLKLLSLQSSAAKKNNIEKFLQLINKHLEDVKNPEALSNMKMEFESALTKLETSKTKLPQVKELHLTSTPQTKFLKAIQLNGVHPAKLLYFENKVPKDLGMMGGIRIAINLSGKTEVEYISPVEPSTIYKDLLISRPNEIGNVDRPNYGPSFFSLLPEQRWIYLEWLNDISQPIDIGYVFLYYYGLERNLILGDFDTAYKEIIFLRHINQNRSFESYSYNALLFASAIKNKPDLIQSLLINESQNGIANEDLIFKYRFGQDISSAEFMSLAKKFKGVNLRYTKNSPNLYMTALSILLTEKFGKSEFPLSSRYELSKIPLVPTLAFANISFPENLRSPKLPEFIKYEPFAQECIEIYSSAHIMVKEELAKQRSNKE